MKSDPVARKIASLALGLALVAVALGVYAVVLGQEYREDVRTLGEALESQRRETPGALDGPPPTLEID